MTPPRPPEIDEMAREVGETVGAMQSATVLIDGIKARVQKAIDDTKAANPGADLSPLTTLVSDLDTASTDLARAVAENPEPSTGRGGSSEGFRR